MDSVRSRFIEENKNVYLKCESKKGLDFVSFNSYPIDMHNKLQKHYQDFSEILNEDGSLEKISSLNEKINDPLKYKYSQFEEIIGYKRMLIKWLGYIDPQISDSDIENSYEFLLDNWLNPHFYPFLPVGSTDTVLSQIPKNQIICRLSSTIPRCISFSYYRDEGIKHCRFKYNPQNNTLTPHAGKTIYKNLEEILLILRSIKSS